MKLFYSLLTGLLLVACTSPEKKAASSDTLPEKPEVKVMGEVTSYVADTTTLIGYVSWNVNDSSKRPGILVVHEWWGHNDYARRRADMLANLGYVALAVDMYGDGKQAHHPDDAGQFARMVLGDFDVAKARFGAAMETLKNHPNVDAEKIGAIGYCFGGSTVLSMANAGYELDAVAAFHAGLTLPVMPDTRAVKGKVLIANGAADKFVTEQQITDYQMAMDRAGADYKFINYEGALHSFTSPAADSLARVHGMDIAYNAPADSASWEEMKQLFAEAF